MLYFGPDTVSVETLMMALAILGLSIVLVLVAWVIQTTALKRKLKDRQDDYWNLSREKAYVEQQLAKSDGTLEQMIRAEKEKNSRLLECDARLNDLQQQNLQLNATVSRQNEQILLERQHGEEKLTELSTLRQAMLNNFMSLSEQAFEKQSEKFVNHNRQQVDAIVAPLREKLVQFQKELNDNRVHNARERADLGAQIRNLTEQSTQMSMETRNLTQALKGKARVQGAWGEMVLESILEKSGLRKDEEYFTQQTHTDKDGGRIRPDVIVNLPGEKRIIIDSKVSLTAFEEYVNAPDDEHRKQALARHRLSLVTHIKELAAKDYQLLAGSELNYVIMFIPIEGALAAAIEHDPALTSQAADTNVVIATPTNLMLALKTVASIWQVERRNRNAEEIARRAGSVYDKFCGFADDLQKLGKALETARTSFDNSMNKLRTGKGSLTRQLETLREMGARTSKQIPAQLLDEVDHIPDIASQPNVPENSFIQHLRKPPDGANS